MSLTSRPGTLQAAALGILLAGSAACWTLSQQTLPAGSVDTRQLRELAARLTAPTEAETALTVPTASGKTLSPLLPKPVAKALQAPVVTKPQSLAGRGGSVPALPPARPQGVPVSNPVPAPTDPLESLALIGITQRAGVDQAWIMDLSRRSQEQVSVGERAFGFTVKSIGAESVTLERDGRSHTLWMGDKPQQLAALGSRGGGESGGEFPGADGGPGPMGGMMLGPGGMMRGPGGMTMAGPAGLRSMGGPGGPGGPGGGNFSGGGFPNRGGGGGDSMASSGGSRGGGGGDFGGFSGGPMTFGIPGGGGGGGMSGGQSGRSGGTGGSSSGSRGGGGSSSGGSGGASSSGSSGSTSNPQTARRNGSRYTGDGETAPAVEERVNPQTQRRTGSTGSTTFGTGESMQDIFGPSSQNGGVRR